MINPYSHAEVCLAIKSCILYGTIDDLNKQRSRPRNQRIGVRSCKNNAYLLEQMKPAYCFAFGLSVW